MRAKVPRRGQSDRYTSNEALEEIGRRTIPRVEAASSS